jgi:hypothetical protein
VEKAGIVEQLQAWFGDLGVPVLALGGYRTNEAIARRSRSAQRTAVSHRTTALPAKHLVGTARTALPSRPPGTLVLSKFSAPRHALGLAVDRLDFPANQRAGESEHAGPKQGVAAVGH